MSSMIITDTDSLHTVSTKAKLNNGLPNDDTQKLIRELISTIPDSALGLSAPQINCFERVFVANFPQRGMFVFVNPVVSKTGSPTTSTEGCLSLPGIQKTIIRSSRAAISADIIYKVNIEHKGVADTMPYLDDLLQPVETLPELQGVEAAIIQHEFDHLEGVLITDLETFVSRSDSVLNRLQSRRLRIQKQRLAKKNKTRVTAPPISPKKLVAMDKMHKNSEKRLTRQMHIEEQRRIEQLNIHSDQF